MIVDSILKLKTNELKPHEWQRLFKKLTYTDGEGNLYEPWVIRPSRVDLPRGAWSLLPDHVRYRDKRIAPTLKEFEFSGQLDSNGFNGQIAALKTMIEQEQGLIIAQPGFGKTEVAVAFAAQAETRTLVLVHTQDILEQWRDRARKLMPDAHVGCIQGPLEDIGDITISTVQTFRQKLRELPQKFKDPFGCVILDEAHHAPANTFDEILTQMPAKFRFGFTATDSRADGKHPYMRLVIGPVIYRKSFESKVPVEVMPVKSHNFKYRWRGSWDWRGLINALISDEDRNAVIGSIAAVEVKEGNSILVLSREIAHLNNIYDHMALSFEFDEGWTQQVKMLTGEMSKDGRKQILADFRSGKVKCILATQLADEALDVPILSRIILTYPGKHDGRIIQQVGRALREHPLKDKAVIYDVVDDRVGILRHQWMQRKQAYKKMKIKVRKLDVR